MEIIYLLKLLRKKWIIFLLVVIFFLAGGGAYYFFQGERYEASLLFYVKRKVEESSKEYYSYDGYYASQVGKEYSSTVVGFFDSIDVLNRASEITSYISSDIASLQNLSKRVVVEKEAPQLVRITVSSENKEESRETVKAIGQAGIERILLLNQTGDPNLSVDVVDQEPLIFTRKNSLVILMGTALLGGIIVGFMSVMAIDIWKKLEQE